MPVHTQRERVPIAVQQCAPRTLYVDTRESRIALFVREDDFHMRVLPRKLAVEVRLGAWDMEGVCVVVLAVRLDRSDAQTYETWLNVGEPTGVRTLQSLAIQPSIDVYVVGENDVRYHPTPSRLHEAAAHVIADLRRRATWNLDAFRRACQRVTQLYPTPSELWWALLPESR